MTRRFLLIFMLTVVCFTFIPPEPEVEAFDPVTLQILTPFALKAASILAPYVVRASGRIAKVVLKGLKEGVYLVVYLPLGLFEVTLLAPWRFRSGFRDLGKGLIAPFKMVGYFLLIPLQPLGVGAD